MTDTPEFSRRYPLSELGSTPRTVTLSAEAAERQALAKRFGLVELASLSAEAIIVERDTGIDATGRIRAKLKQACVATGAPISSTIDEPFSLRFVANLETEADEIELETSECDVIEHDGLGIDLGEAVAQTVLLALDPFPRAAGADKALKDAGVLQAEDASPFAGLKGLFGGS
jgi:uncharacterized metal-binding protein YceD (DUF177 family)